MLFASTVLAWLALSATFLTINAQEPAEPEPEPEPPTKECQTIDFSEYFARLGEEWISPKNGKNAEIYWGYGMRVDGQNSEKLVVIDTALEAAQYAMSSSSSGNGIAIQDPSKIYKPSAYGPGVMLFKFETPVDLKSIHFVKKYAGIKVSYKKKDNSWSQWYTYDQSGPGPLSEYFTDKIDIKEIKVRFFDPAAVTKIEFCTYCSEQGGYSCNPPPCDHEDPACALGEDDDMNTAEPEESESQRRDRLDGKVPEGSIPHKYDPLDDAICYNDAYSKPSLSHTESLELYEDYAKIFEWGFKNMMGSPLQSVSDDNNGVTNNRFPGMFLRMCFHDNSVNLYKSKFQNYVKNKITSGNFENFSGKFFQLGTSGADASVLVCPKERYHPNQNYDKTASRVLRSMTQSDVGIKYEDLDISLKDKWDMSYSDMLQNGCNAAVIWLTELNQDVPGALYKSPFEFGRRDACYTKSSGERFAACGPTNLLPGLMMTTSELNSWFVDRGMGECQWMSTMWTHTTMDNMANTCPLRELPALMDQAKYDEYIVSPKFSEPSSRGGIYFEPYDVVDYFDHFLDQGHHQPNDEFRTNPESGSCDWDVDLDDDGTKERRPWPLTVADCNLSTTQAEKAGEVALVQAIKNFHKSTHYTPYILLCALKGLSGKGKNLAYKGTCPLVPDECKSDTNQFGAFFGIN